MFDADRVDEALTRFEALAAEPPPLPVTRRVRENAATAHLARLDAASRARDSDALASLLSADLRIVSHVSGAAVRRREVLDWWRLFFADREASYEFEPLATLGERLALTRQLWIGSSGASAPLEVGPFESEVSSVYEVDGEGRAVNVESFAQLGPALARLYARHAELLPEGPERARAVAAARAMATCAEPLEAERMRPVLAPDVECVDRRTAGFGSWHGAESILRGVHRAIDVAGERDVRIDVLAARPDALVVARTVSGIDDRTGGEYENVMLTLYQLEAAGRIRRWEVFDPGRVAAALARFDELTGDPRPAPRRRMRPNFATANVARLRAALAAGDRAALAAVHAPALRAVLHPTGAVLDREQTLAWWRLFLEDRDSDFRLEPIATLGDSLALCANPRTGSGSGLGSFDVAAYETTELALVEADAEARLVRVESFAEGRLRDAVIRLYERYAERLPEGPARTQAATAARTVAVMESLTHTSLDAVTAVLAPDVAFTDHRSVVGLPPARGADEMRRRIASWFEPVEEAASVSHDVVALCPTGMLVRAVERGRDRGGADFERHYLILRAFDADGLESHIELFDPDDVDAALARFDALIAEPRPGPRRRVRPNAATENGARLAAAMQARDVGAVAEHYAPAVEVLHHPTGSSWDRDEVIAVVRDALAGAPDLVYEDEPLASLGTALALLRTSVRSASGTSFGGLDVGPSSASTSRWSRSMRRAGGAAPRPSIRSVSVTRWCASTSAMRSCCPRGSSERRPRGPRAWSGSCSATTARLPSS